MILIFKKDSQGWYVDIQGPHPFSRSALAMVAGADTFLDILSEGEDIVRLSIFEEYVGGYNKLVRTNVYGFGLGGADYVLHEYNNQVIDYQMWLCSVNMFIFKGQHPKEIYFSKLAS